MTHSAQSMVWKKQDKEREERKHLIRLIKFEHEHREMVEPCWAYPILLASHPVNLN